VSARNYVMFTVGATLRGTSEAANAIAKPAHRERQAAALILGRAVIPIRAALLAIARPAAQEIQPERNRRKQQQKMNQRSCGQVHCVIE
jgi:hypothetical protein